MNVLLIAEHDNKQLSPQTAKALTAGLNLGEVDILVAGEGCKSVAAEAAKLSGLRNVLVAESEALSAQLAECVQQVVLSLAPDYQAIISPATTTGKNILPRIAAKLDVMQISDVMEVIDESTYKRPIYAGNAVQTVRSTDSVKVMTIRTASFDAAESNGNAPVRDLDVALSGVDVRHVADEVSVSERPELTSARVIVTGGRALGSKDKFEQTILPVADKLGAAVGASRAAVDAGFAPNDWQVGQTGKIVAPELYIACGVSGAIQHLAGIKDAKVIVAINTDPDAPIFQVADYGLEMDLFDALPELQSLL